MANASTFRFAGALETDPIALISSPWSRSVYFPSLLTNFFLYAFGCDVAWVDGRILFNSENQAEKNEEISFLRFQ